MLEVSNLVGDRSQLHRSRRGGLRDLGLGLGEISLGSSVAVRFSGWWLDFGRAGIEGDSGFQKLVVAQGVLKR